VLLKIKPRTKGRPRHRKGGGTYTPPVTREFEKKVRDAWVEQHPEGPVDGPVAVNMVVGPDHIRVDVKPIIWVSRPKGVTGDLDNYYKSIQDALNTVAFHDDKQVVVSVATFTETKFEEFIDGKEPDETENDTAENIEPHVPVRRRRPDVAKGRRSKS
jgi:crossover junction endodeoxyribonuclease RusA